MKFRYQALYCATVMVALALTSTIAFSYGDLVGFGRAKAVLCHRTKACCCNDCPCKVCECGK